MPVVDDSSHAVGAWAASGAMWLTGHAGGAPLSPAAAVVPVLASAADALARLTAAGGRPVRVDVGTLLSGRAALRGLGRRGRTSANGSCRLLPAADGWVAVNLARPSDVESVGALVERAVDGDPWVTLERAAARLPADDLVARATLLGIPAAFLPPTPAQAYGCRTVGDVEHTGRPASPAERADAGPRPPYVVRRLGESRREAPTRGAPAPLVVDLSAMWAGPVCAHLLGRAGLRVVKVESTHRPDGARAGHAGFFDWLHGGHDSVALDFSTATGRADLATLVAQADVVIESSRPRALAQLGIDPAAVLAGRPATTWVSITGHGRDGDDGHRVAFGDDAAVAAGLVAHDHDGLPVFCGDAIADPITGLFAAVAALASQADGGGHLVEVAMVDAVAATLATPAPATAAHRLPDGTWAVRTPAGDLRPVARPRPPGPAALATPAHPLGADTDTYVPAGRPAC